MAVIAIAGGTGKGLGRNVVIGCAQNPKHKVLVLSRESSKTPEWLEQLTNVEVRRVDYSSEASLAKALHGVDTVISTLLATDGTQASSQIRLLNAGLTAGISRFSPAEWGLGPLNYERVEILRSALEVRDVLRAATKRHAGNFEWGAFHVGAFMNYLGLEHPTDAAAWNGLEDGKLYWDVKNMTAQLPKTKERKSPRITMTELTDVGRMVSAACELPFGTWKEHMGIAGDVKTLDEVTAIVEKVRNKKMEVEYLFPEAIEGLINISKDPLERMWWEFYLASARDEDNEVVFENNVNVLVEDKVRPTTIEEFLTKFWGAVQADGLPTH